MQKWEYAKLQLNEERHEIIFEEFHSGKITEYDMWHDAINDTGLDGWELAGTTLENLPVVTTFFFKRPLED
jgi:hypothetical protein